jgi:hypothetical protein
MQFKARILKHLLEAEKSTSREKLSFQKSESTTGNSFRVMIAQAILCEQLIKNKNLDRNDTTVHVYLVLKISFAHLEVLHSH